MSDDLSRVLDTVAEHAAGLSAALRDLAAGQVHGVSECSATSWDLAPGDTQDDEPGDGAASCPATPLTPPPGGLGTIAADRVGTVIHVEVHGSVIDIDDLAARVRRAQLRDQLRAGISRSPLSAQPRGHGFAVGGEVRGGMDLDEVDHFVSVSCSCGTAARGARSDNPTCPMHHPEPQSLTINVSGATVSVDEVASAISTAIRSHG